MRLTLFIYILLASLPWFQTATAETLSVVYTSNRGGSENRSFFVEALTLALEKSRDTHGNYNLRALGKHMNQARQIKTVASGEADIMWTMTTNERERTLLPVKFPLLKGYIGKRVFVIRADRQGEFASDMTTMQLKVKLAVQGLNWPDTEILRHNGFRVETVDWGNWFDNLFEVIKRDKADYFPRSIIEVGLELDRLNDPSLSIEHHHLLDYPAYMYFLVNPERPEIAKRVLAGLQAAVASGEFDELFYSFKHHQQARLLLEQSRNIHSLENPLINSVR